MPERERAFQAQPRTDMVVELYNEYQDPEDALELFEDMRHCRAGIATPEDAVAHIVRFREEVGPMIVDGQPTCLCANVWEACHQIEAMGKRRLRWAVPLLTRLLYHRDPDFDSCPEYAIEIQAAAAHALGRIGDLRAIRPLLARLDEGPLDPSLTQDAGEPDVPPMALDDAMTASLDALDTLGAGLIGEGPSRRHPS